MRRPLAACSIALALLALPADAATAKAKRADADKATAYAGFNLRGSNGYSISVGGGEGEVTLEARGSAGSASYQVRGHVTAQGIWARFGKRGRIAVEFRPSGSLNRRVPPGRCKGGPRTTRWGSFVGTIRFAGEHGYTEVDAGRVQGRTHVHRPWRCKPSRGGGGGDGGQSCRVVEEEPGEAIVLDASSRRQRRSFGAFTERAPDGETTTLFFAGSFEDRGRMEVSRVIFGEGKEEAFVFDEGLASAIVRPPAPFEGSATFVRKPDDGRPRWRGGLRVSLPGAPHTRLTGPGFKARLLRPALEPTETVICTFAALREKAASP